MLTRMVNRLPFGISQQLTKLNLRALVWNQKRDHSIAEYHPFNNMEVQVLPVLHDNYMYLLVDKFSRDAAIVDPVNPKSVMEAVKVHRVNLTSVLTTHYHWDHAGGNLELVQMNPKLKVYGGDERIGGLTHKVDHKSVLHIGRLNVICLSTPGHTAGDVCYLTAPPLDGTESAVFSGDTLFLGGCGKFMEGTADQMYAALIQILSKLPDKTKVFCGHEYTLNNLIFASYVPSTIGEEKMYNPFMRVLEPTVMQHANTSDAIQTMKAIRLEKDSFRG